MLKEVSIYSNSTIIMPIPQSYRWGHNYRDRTKGVNESPSGKGRERRQEDGVGERGESMQGINWHESKEGEERERKK